MTYCFGGNPSIETLERRDLMAADAILTNGILHVTGTDSDDDIGRCSEYWSAFQRRPGPLH
jgi:hypothetical protein